MPIAHVRIDDRLIHGQVVNGWLSPLGITQVLVVSDRVSKEPVHKTLMEIAASDAVSVLTLNVSQSIAWFKQNQSVQDTVMVLAPGPREILQLLEGGVRFPVLSLGGLHSPNPKRTLTPSILLTDSDCADLKKIAGMGVRLEIQALPDDPPRSVPESALN